MTNQARCPRPRRVRGQAGSLTLELAVLFPVFLLLVTAAAQAALYFYARSVALAAAQTGLRDARLAPAELARGVSAAAGYAKTAGGSFLTGTAISTTGSTATVVRITVTGRPLSLLPGFDPTISQDATGPVEVPTLPTATTR